MCGIAGIVAFASECCPSEAQLKKMCDSLYHRGPDDEGIDIQGSVALGMRRLSIIDVAGGHQPLFNEDRSVRVVFNGEIYNFQQLARQLEEKGHSFRTRTDGEVIAHLWEEQGPDFARHLNGMFAIALHDSRNQKLVLVRDRVGIKPLYYCCEPGKFLVFGSEIKALLASQLFKPELDLDALAQFLAWEYVPTPRTLLKKVRKLEQGGMLIVDLNRREVTSKVWWTLPSSTSQTETPRRSEEWFEEVQAKIVESVRRQMISDVPLGAFLSGGVDSSVVVSAMGRAKAFSIGFDDPSYNEVEYARRVARHLGVEQRVRVMRPDVLKLFDHLMNFMDDPIGDFSVFPTYLISKVAREEVKVALSGDGGDEVFGGYETYLAEQAAQQWKKLPSLLTNGIIDPLLSRLKPQRQKKGLINKTKRFIEGLHNPATLGHARWRLFAGEALQRRLFTRGALAEVRTPLVQHVLDLQAGSDHRPDIDRGLYVDFRSYLVDNCLLKVDRMSMACSLEVRVPLLDHELVELAFRAPSHLKVNKGKTKILLKAIAAARVPPDCVYRPKEGFSIPIKNWLGNELRPLMEDLLSPASIRREGIFDPEVVERMKNEHLSQKQNHSHVLWSMLVFQDWRRRWGV